MKSPWDKAFLLEMTVADIISRQAKHGTQFNLRNAKWHIHSLTEKIVKIDMELIPLLPKMLNKGTEYKKPFVKSGAFAKYPGEYCARHGLQRHEVGAPFTAVWYTAFDPSKTARVKEVMLDIGWVPTEWNEKKMPFQVFKYRKLLRESNTYEKFFAKFVKDNPEEAEFLDAQIEAFISDNFTGKSKAHRDAVLSGLGFNKTKRTKGIITRDMVKKQLASKQFWPTSAKITEDSFEDLGENESRTLYLLKQRMVWSHRRSLITGLIENLRPDGKLSGEANPCATPTARMRHKIIVNIPAAGAPFGKECRSLFMGNYNGKSDHLVVRKLTQPMIDSGMFRRKPGTNIMQESDGKGGWEDCGYCAYYVKRGYDCFVGGDGAGLELRMLTHYLVSVSKMLLADAKRRKDSRDIAKYEASLQSAYEYREVLLNGDIHSHNQKLAGLPTRKAAKTFIYAFLYGAGDANLGNQLGGDAKVGAKLRETFLRECPCIPVLIEWVQGHAEYYGYVPAIDGRKLIMRRDPITKEVMVHKALNTMLQAAGSIVMKRAMCFLDEWVKRDGLTCHQVIMMHDEMQFTCPVEEVAALRKLIDSCVAAAGKRYNMECPLASDSMWGPNWYATH